VYATLGRVSNLPTIATQTAAALAIAGEPVDAADVLIVGGGLSATYVAGMFLNDAFDRSFDAYDRPDRPIPAGHVDALEVFLAGGGLLALGVVLLTLDGVRHRHTPLALCAALALAIAVVAYDAHHKRSAVAPLTMGACRGLVYVCAAASVAGWPSLWSMLAALVMAVYVSGLSEVAKRERRPYIGAKGLMVAPLALGVAMLPHSVAAAVFSMSLMAVVVHALRLAREGERERGTVLLIAGISLVDAVLLIVSGHLLLAIGAAVTPLVTRALQRVVRGT
jgi:4-hydroxybenzoate polyprenyltransferase